EQAATLAKIAGYDLDKHAVEKQQIFAERTVVNRKAKEAASQLAGMQPVPPETPDVEESVTAIVEELNAAQEHNQRVRSARAAVETAEREERELRERFERSRDVPAELINQRDREIERIKADFAAKIETAKDASNRLGLKLDEYVAKVVSTKAAADSLTMMETAGLQERATKAEGVNRNVWAKRNRAAKKAEVEELERKGEELTAKLEALEAAKAKTIASTEFPIDGLDVSESGVCIDGIPFAQCSGAQRLKTSVAIGLALNPTLKLMLIRDGSLLDESSMGMLADMAAAANAQVLIERVANAGEVGVRIVDGETVDDAAEAKVAA
ncbi:MAG TPA: hypothetical protein DCE44_18895, partial [Verrucomicrobiales bacterium]|nr:hypothetical protein [Verrucomicrobiales bacterium]